MGIRATKCIQTKHTTLRNYLSMNSKNIHHVIIIGAGFGGLTCARYLSKAKNVEITLIDRQNHHLFQPLLYQVATATLSAPDIARSIRSILAKQKNVKIAYQEASKIDIQTKTIHFYSGSEMNYDSLVIATGARTSFFGNNHWANHVHQMKSLSDAVKLRKSILRNLELAEQTNGSEQAKLATVIIVGGGPTGVELAGAFADLIKRNMRHNFRHFDTAKQKIILIEAQERLLTSFDPSHSEYTKHRLSKLGVDILINTMVKDISHEKVTLSNAQTIEASTIIWTAGVEATDINHTLGVETTNAGLVKVNQNLSIPDYPSVFVIGDAASCKQKNGHPVPGVAPAASQAGKHVAHIIRKYILKNNFNQTDYPDFNYKDKGSMAIIGKSAAVVKIKSWKIKGWFAWLIWLGVHVLFLVSFRNKIAVMFNWFWAYIGNVHGTRVFTSSSHTLSTQTAISNSEEENK